MAVIEEESDGDSSSKSQLNSAAVAAPSGYDSDGYETASETELDNSVSEQGSYSDNINANSVRSAEKREGEGEGCRDITPEQKEMSESIQNQVNEKALEQANVAKLEGNSLFKAGLYEEALSKYELAIQISPDGPSSTEIQSICHANRAACLSKLGNFEETIKECTKALELNSTYIKALLRRGEAREKLEQYEESITDMTKILELDQSNDQARRAIIRLKPLADEKREKMKEEMIEKKCKSNLLTRLALPVMGYYIIEGRQVAANPFNIFYMRYRVLIT